ncbi:MAG: oligosaccharide repeat unit polymerase [Spirochaetia bacterium]|jgi:hypothetical protein|nr:oligosaccharide repeat unit polymerase [Spirochaetia bacterium]
MFILKILCCFLSLLIFIYQIKQLRKINDFIPLAFAIIYIFSFTIIPLYGFFPNLIFTYKYIKYSYFIYDDILWMKLFLFIFLSHCFLYLFCKHFIASFKYENKIIIVRKTTPTSLFFHFLFYLFLGLLIFIDIYLFVINFHKINYYSKNNATFLQQNSSIALCLFLFKYSENFLLLFFALTLKNKRVFIKFVFLVLLVLELIFIFLSGDRSGFVDILLGVFGILFYKRKFSYRNIFKIVIVGVIAIGALLYISKLTRKNVEDMGLFSLIKAISSGQLINIAVIKLNYIKPLEFLKCNFIKSFPFTKYHYLYAPIEGIFSTSVIDNIHSFGTSLYYEGFVFCGLFGVFFNGFYYFILLKIWNYFIQFRNSDVNRLMNGLLLYNIFAVARGTGSVLMIRTIWLVFIPILFFYLVLTNQTIEFRNAKKNK